MATFTSTKRTEPPVWAVLERQLIDALNQAAPVYIDKYTRTGGSLVWTEQYPGDGVWVDDLYEAFFNWPLLYALGGSEYIGEKAVGQWNAVTRQITYDYGRIAREFVCDDDWFHSSENYVYFYAIGLADPANGRDDAPGAALLRLLHGRGPRGAELRPGAPHRPLAVQRQRRPDVPRPLGRRAVQHRARPRQALPDLRDPPEWMERRSTPEERESHRSEGEDGGLWFEDPAKRERIHAMFDKIVMEGDVPVNLGVVGLVAHTYTLTGDDKYRTWIADYVEAWMERIERNGGIIPDNVGLDGRIGENRQGQWWGGFYGWAASSSYQMMFNAMTVASTCAHLVTGDKGYLDLARSQFDMLLERAVEREGRVLIPYRHNEEGWIGHAPMGHQQPIQLWFASQEERDWQRLETIRRGRRRSGAACAQNDPRGADDRAWTRYLAGGCPGFPEEVLQANYREMMRRMDLIESDDADLTDLSQTDEHHWLQRNPVVTEALQLLTTGGPQTNYWGGLARGRVRYFDRGRQRPGLPDDVAALVSGVRPDGIDLTLVNLSPHRSRELTVQAGAFGEHRFSTAAEPGDPAAGSPSTAGISTSSCGPHRDRAQTRHGPALPPAELRLSLARRLHPVPVRRREPGRPPASLPPQRSARVWRAIAALLKVW